MLLRVEISTKKSWSDDEKFRRRLTAAILREAADLADTLNIELLRVQTVTAKKAA